MCQLQNSILIQLNFCIKYRKTFFDKEKRQKTNIAVLNCYKQGVMKNSEDDFHDWKVKPILFMGKYLRKNFKFYDNTGLSGHFYLNSTS